MRTRSKLIAGGSTPGGYCQFWVNGSFSHNQIVKSPAVVNMTTSVITDDPKGRGWKPVRHITATEFANIDTECRYGPSPGNATNKGPNAYWFTWATVPQHYALDQYSLEYSHTIEQQKSAAYAQFLSGNEVNTLLNVWEAPQLADSVSSLKKTLSLRSTKEALRQVVQGNSAFARDFKQLGRFRPSLGKTASLISGNYLAYSFGIAPLLSDMRRVEKASVDFVDKMRSATKRVGQPTVSRHISYGEGTALRRDLTDHYLQGSVQSSRIISMRGVNSVKYNSQKLREVDYVMKRWGSPGPASMAWERIPFSFVVDWFLDTSVLLGSLDNLLTGGSKKVDSIMCTTESLYTSEMIHQVVGYPNSSISNGTVVAGLNSRVYDREILSGLPPLVSWKGRFGKKQLALTGALLYQQVAKRY